MHDDELKTEIELLSPLFFEAENSRAVIVNGSLFWNSMNEFENDLEDTFLNLENNEREYFFTFDNCETASKTDTTWTIDGHSVQFLRAV